MTQPRRIPAPSPRAPSCGAPDLLPQAPHLAGPLAASSHGASPLVNLCASFCDPPAFRGASGAVPVVRGRPVRVKRKRGVPTEAVENHTLSLNQKVAGLPTLGPPATRPSAIACGRGSCRRHPLPHPTPGSSIHGPGARCLPLLGLRAGVQEARAYPDA